MKKENFIILDYQNNFIDNLSAIAYGKILENKFNKKCYFENSSKKREFLEKITANFNLSLEYISSSRVKSIKNNRFSIYNLKPLKKELSKNYSEEKDYFLNFNRFRIEDLEYISPKIKKYFKFKNLNFITNYDILEKLNSTGSIGLYINKNDINDIDYDFIYRATTRINKYIKNPKLYIFSQKEIENKIKSEIPFEINNLSDWREEFYFLINCRHGIILNTKNSYSEGFWASVLSQNEYSINIFDKKLSKNPNKFWIGI